MKNNEEKKEVTEPVPIKQGLHASIDAKVNDVKLANKNYNEHIGTIGMAIGIDPQKYQFDLDTKSFVPIK